MSAVTGVPFGFGGALDAGGAGGGSSGGRAAGGKPVELDFGAGAVAEGVGPGGIVAVGDGLNAF